MKKLYMPNSTRSSNIELLRIFAIVFIILHHLLVHGMHIWDDESIDNFPLLSLDSLLFVGVNIFVLISGYCGIKLRLYKFFYLWLMCAVVGGFGYAIHLYLDNQALGKSIIFNTIFSISHAPGTWYIKVYIYLMLLSPILNTAIECLSKKQYQIVLVCVSLICIYFGWWWQDDVNKDGYNVVNFMWIYLLGAYIKKWLSIEYNNTIRLMCVATFLLCAIGNAILCVFCGKFGYVSWTYNNPLIVISAIAFFILFISFDCQSKFINFLSQSTLGIYLLHENSYISKWIYTGSIAELYTSTPYLIIVVALCVYILCAGVDMLLRYGIVKPLMKILPPPHTHTHLKR